MIQSGALSASTYIGSSTNKVQGTDPLFIYAPLASAAPSTNGDFHLFFNSAAINMGSNSANNQFIDLDSLPRIAQSTIDIGAYEFTPCLLYTSRCV